MNSMQVFRSPETTMHQTDYSSPIQHNHCLSLRMRWRLGSRLHIRTTGRSPSLRPTTTTRLLPFLKLAPRRDPPLRGLRPPRRKHEPLCPAPGRHHRVRPPGQDLPLAPAAGVQGDAEQQRRVDGELVALLPIPVAVILVGPAAARDEGPAPRHAETIRQPGQRLQVRAVDGHGRAAVEKGEQRAQHADRVHGARHHQPGEPARARAVDDGSCARPPAAFAVVVAATVGLPGGDLVGGFGGGFGGVDGVEGGLE